MAFTSSSMGLREVTTWVLARVLVDARSVAAPNAMRPVKRLVVM
jgi:hypothetical protein